jgi:TonB-dependent siderophore receptor
MDRLRLFGTILLMGIWISGMTWESKVFAEEVQKKKGATEASEEDQSEEMKTYTLEGIVVRGNKEAIPTESSVATKMPVSIQKTPASVGVVTKALVDRQDGVVLGDALKNVSGVNVQTGFGVHDYFVIRGFDSLTGGLVLTDGIPEPEASFYNMYNVERVEVLKGPGAFLYGGNPLSGSVNLQRKQPVFGKFASVSGSYGQYNSYRAAVDVGRGDVDQGVAFRINALRSVSDQYRDEKNSSTWAFHPTFLWQWNEKHSVTVGFEYVDSGYKSDSGLPVVNNALPDVPRTRSYQSPFDVSDQLIHRLRAEFNTQLTPSVTLRNRIYYTDFDWISRGTLFSGVFPNAQGSLDLYRSLLLLDDRQKVVGNQLEAVFRFDTGSSRHTLLAGIELSRWQDAFGLDVGVLPNLDLFAPVETAAEPHVLIPGQSQMADARSVVLAPYFVDQISFSDRFQMFLGGRYDDIDYADKVTRTERKFSKFSPMAGLVVSPTPDFSVYGNFGQAFSPPSSQVVGDRKAEAARQFEIGMKKFLADGRLNATLAVYHLKKDNVAIPDATGITQQDGDQRSKGMELELALQTSPGWQTYFSYAFTESELTRFREMVMVPTQTGVTFNMVDRSGNKPAFTPKHILNVWTTRTFANGLGIAGGARYVHEQFIAEDNQYKIDGSMILDGALFYKYQKITVRMNLKNLTNKEYETRGFGSSSVIPANPFGMYCGFDLRM